ncbi:AAA family ATPase [Clostridium botulinum]|nr:AAA family ATPase [Clostridium botulinum]NFE93533.1 AAA family ATPase [Clostridium botulinum]NFL38094.1 AAA family ATPase [Clostridium botulinum]NFL64418.1 AAA family ATPase [Clostridium botulinum]NFN07965.1 AAA family ATPase [Clostridium botulinum]NFN24130.1 AAA family ATPase [Clostridium botulinum]
MNLYLNTDKPLKNYNELFNEEYFVDKSLIIKLLNKKINTKSKYVCVTRPRRFGKSSVADMLGAYYSKAVDSKNIFDKLKISKAYGYEENLNKYNVISISFNRLSDIGNTYDDYINRIKINLKEDIKEMYSHIDADKYLSISDLLESLSDKFIFIFDEWDYIFNNNLFEENQNDFLEFLRNLLKDQPYVALCYMTGVLPIKKYSSGSALNMFDEFTFLRDRKLGEYFGFTEDEVIALCDKNGEINFRELENWYNGYTTASGIKIYNPRSVIKSLENNYCESYWTNTGAMYEVCEYLKYNTLEIRDDVIKMVSGEEIDIIINEEFRAGQGAPRNKEEIYSAMIVLGFLSYYDGYLKIPNKELMQEFEKALRDESFGYVSEIIENSKRMLKATVNGEIKVVEEILHDIHNSEIPILQYFNREPDSFHSLGKFREPNQRFGSSLENSLSCVLTLAYLSARDTYRVEREEKTGKGYADFTFHPRRKNDIPFIVELKKDELPEVAINQIKQKEYVEKFRNENKGKKVLAVAICYDSKKKEHKCKIEEI